MLKRLYRFDFFFWSWSHSFRSIHPTITTLSLLWGGWFFYAGANPSCLWGESRVLPRQVASSSQGPHWWQRPPCRVPTTHQEQFGVQYLAQGHFDMQPALLYPLSYSRPILFGVNGNFPNIVVYLLVLRNELEWMKEGSWRCWIWLWGRRLHWNQRERHGGTHWHTPESSLTTDQSVIWKAQVWPIMLTMAPFN